MSKFWIDFIRQRDVMRANFACDFHPARPRFTKKPHTAGCRDVLAMNVMVAKFREEDVTRDDRLPRRRGPARQAEQRAPITFVDDAIADEIVILAVIEQRYADHSRILDRAPHEFVI